MTAPGKSLAASVAGHVLVVAALIWLVGRAPPLQLPAHSPANSVDVAFAPPIPAPPPLVAPEPPPPPPLAEEPPPPPPLAEEPPPPLPVVVAQPPPPPPKPVLHRPVRPPVERRVVVRPERPPPERRLAQPEPRMMEPEPRFAPPQPRYSPPMQTASLPPAPAPAPAAPAPGPMITAGYRAALSAWLESHKQYPQAARERGEQGRVVLRFRVARNGQVLSYSVAGSSGYPDLDAAVDAMMRGAALPPFPPEMASPEIEVAVTVRFALAR